MMQGGALQVSMPSDREIAMTRVFDAPRSLVFDAYTKPELLKRWAGGPPGWNLVECEVDLRVGGAWRWVIKGPEGERMALGGVYLDVVPPERLVSTEAYDEPWYEGEATSMLVLIEREGRTTMTTTVRYASRVVRDGVLKTGMAEGFGAGLDRMAELLASLQGG
jgi:uncharacterized protein YndB with AHSA1/START domain